MAGDLAGRVGLEEAINTAHHDWEIHSLGRGVDLVLPLRTWRRIDCADLDKNLFGFEVVWVVREMTGLGLELHKVGLTLAHANPLFQNTHTHTHDVSCLF